MLLLDMSDMVGHNVASSDIQKIQERNFIRRLEHNLPIHAKRLYRWGSHPIGRYALYSTAIWIFPQHKVKTALRAARKFHSIIETAKSATKDIMDLID